MVKTIKELGLSTRVKNILMRNNIFDTEDLKKYSLEKLMKLPRFGHHSLVEVNEALIKEGIILKVLEED